MTPIEHYLRNTLNIEPNSALMNEMLNYLLKKGYEPDYQKIIDKADGKVYAVGKDSKATIKWQTADEGRYLVVEEFGIFYDDNSVLNGNGITTNIDISENKKHIDLGISMSIAGFTAEMDNYRFGYAGNLFGQGEDSALLTKLDLSPLKSLGIEIEDNNLLLYFTMRLMQKEIAKAKSAQVFKKSRYGK